MLYFNASLILVIALSEAEGDFDSGGNTFASTIDVSGNCWQVLARRIIANMSRLANPWDNAKCESFIKTLKQEEIRANEYRDLEHLRKNVTEFVEHYYHRQRLHSALGYQTPEAFEREMTLAAAEETAAMSFLGIRRSINPTYRSKRSRPKTGSRSIALMSLRPVIPRRVGLHQRRLRFAGLSGLKAVSQIVGERCHDLLRDPVMACCMIRWSLELGRDPERLENRAKLPFDQSFRRLNVAEQPKTIHFSRLARTRGDHLWDVRDD